MTTDKNTTEYRGYTITEVFDYLNGWADYEVVKGDDEKVSIYHYHTLDYVKRCIDETIEDETLSAMI